MFSEIRPKSWLTKIRKLFHLTSRKQTVQGECIMNEQQPNSLRMKITRNDNAVKLGGSD